MSLNRPIFEIAETSQTRNSGTQSIVTNQQLTRWVGSSAYLYDAWAPFNVQVDGPHQIPVLRGIDSLPPDFKILSYSRKPRTAPQGVSIINFWEPDQGFAGIFTNPVRTASSLAKFSFVISPDPTLYSSNAEHMRLNTIWRSRAIASYFEYRGLNVIPQVRWTSDSDLDAALAGLRHGSVVAVSNLGCYRSNASKKEFCRGLSRLLEQVAPSQLLLHGTDDFKTRSIRWGDTEKIHRPSRTSQYFSGGTTRG